MMIQAFKDQNTRQEPKQERVYAPQFSLQWHITSKCDLSCLHCYSANSKDLDSQRSNELSLQDCFKVIDSFIDFCTIAPAKPIINLTGGDPLLRDDVFEIASYAHQRGVGLRMMGNPNHLSDGIIKKLKSYGIENYQISIDGLEETHESFRGKGSFKTAVEGLDVLTRNNVTSVVMYTLSKQNENDLTRVMEMCSELGVSIFGFARYVNTEQNPILYSTFTPGEYCKILQKVEEQMRSLRSKGSQTRFTYKDHLWKLVHYEQGKLKTLPNSQNKIISGCHLGCGLSILPNGDVYACRRFPSLIGHFPEQSFLEVYVGEAMNRYREIKNLEKCSKCKLLYYCRGCPAVSYGVTGNWQSADPQCWLEIEEN